MAELAIQADKLHTPNDEAVDPEKEKQAAIELCQRRINAAVILFADGRIEQEEYRRKVEQNEREIAHWQSRTTEVEKAALELTMCIDALDKLAMLWDIGDDLDRQGMARTLFSYIVYDLDTRRITDFRLKPWADRFLVLREALYENEETASGSQDWATKVEAEEGASAGSQASPSKNRISRKSR